MHPLVSRLQAWLRIHRAGYLAELAPGAPNVALERLRRRVPTALPPLFEELLRWHDGQNEDCFQGLEFNRQWMSIAQIVETMDIMEELLEAGEFSSVDWWSTAWVPFLSNGGGDLQVIDLEGRFGGRPGQVLEFWHDDNARTITYPSFEAWLRTFVEALEADLFEVEGGDLHPMDDEALEEFVAKRNPGYPIEVCAE
jgi:cell wall assembly regulator SMI1